MRSKQDSKKANDKTEQICAHCGKDAVNSQPHKPWVRVSSAGAPIYD